MEVKKRTVLTKASSLNFNFTFERKDTKVIE